MGKRPTEEDLGIAPTAEEMAEQNAPRVETDDDIPQIDDADDIHQVAAPKKDEGETEEQKAQRLRDEAGRFTRAPEGQPQPEQQQRQPPPKGYVEQEALRQSREENRVLTERFNTLMEVINKRNAPKEEAPPAQVIPDKATDPLGYIDYLEGRVGKIEGESAAQAKQRQEAEAETAELNKALEVALPQFTEAAAADPTINDQYNALLASMAREIAFVNGIPTNQPLTPQQKNFIGAELTKLEHGHIRFAVAQGRNVAEYMREFAESRGIGVPAGAAPAPKADTALAAPATVRTIQERQQAQQRHMSLGDLPGTAAPSSITAKDIAKMTPTQFKAFAKSIGEDGLDELMGKA